MSEIGQQVELYTCHRADGSPSAERQIYKRGFRLHLKKETSKNNLGIPDHHIASFAKGIYPLMVKHFEREQGQRNLADCPNRQQLRVHPAAFSKKESEPCDAGLPPDSTNQI